MASPQELLDQLRNIDFQQLDANNIGSWPGMVKAIILIMAFALALGIGYIAYVRGLIDALDRHSRQEESLKQEYEDKAFKSANLGALRRQRDEMEDQFGSLLRQLPSDTEVPGLIDDIDEMARESGLEVEQLDPEPERAAEFYVEKPIKIIVKGRFHDLGEFVSGVANLSRIVTLHDFEIKPQSGPGDLRMSILAKTYRYLDEDEVVPAETQ
ncbi:MAG: type 4a pilus biogenesis protein PilO [Gammaproteobacteria bacterium]|jgi:type IV pilus assembly protein PilO